jgi:8-oxo-dGTP pyrophosphatase MutT (NUDIX family)
MTFAVALGMLEREGRWLLQLRDDIEGIVHPGCWGLFGGHLDPGERPEQAVLRELQEESQLRRLVERLRRLPACPPLLVKIAPDLEDDAIDALARLA